MGLFDLFRNSERFEDPERLQDVEEELAEIPDGVLLWYAELKVTKNIANPILKDFSPKLERIVSRGNWTGIQYEPAWHFREGKVRGYYGTMRTGEIKRLLEDPDVRDHFVDFSYKFRQDHIEAMLNKPFYD